jgi:hypothetical protein
MVIMHPAPQQHSTESWPCTCPRSYCLNATEVERDARQMFSVTRRVRTYAIACPNSTDVLLNVARRMGGQVFIGVRLGDTQAKIDNVSKPHSIPTKFEFMCAALITTPARADH